MPHFTIVLAGFLSWPIVLFLPWVLASGWGGMHVFYLLITINIYLHIFIFLAYVISLPKLLKLKDDPRFYALFSLAYYGVVTTLIFFTNLKHLLH